MRIILRQKCGLGNQLFQYAAGLFFAKKYGATLEVIPEPDNLAVSFGHPRPFMLTHFCISAPVRELTSWDRLICSVARIKKPVAATARLLSRTAVFRPHFMTDCTFLPELPIPASCRNVYLDGYFQAYQFAQNMEDLVRKELSFRNPASGNNLDVLNEIRTARNSVSLHVRHGDYALRTDGPALMSLGYHAQAMRVCTEKLGNPIFYVFSDNIAFARDNLPKGYNMVFVDHNDEANGHEDLRLMSACAHNIIANSSFSWWGAWLNPSPSKIVCAPASWHNVNLEVPYPDLIPPSWLRISMDAK